MNLITTALMGLFLLSGVNGSTLASIQDALASAPAYTVSMTGYNAVPAQTDADPTTTASGAYSNPDVVAARSRDLADKLPYGTVIAVETSSATSKGCGASVVEDQIGYRVIADSMAARMHNKIDILFDHETSVTVGKKEVNPAIAFGICEGVTIRVVGKIDIKDMPRNQAELKRVVDQQLLAVSK